MLRLWQGHHEEPKREKESLQKNKRKNEKVWKRKKDRNKRKRIGGKMIR